MRECVSVRKVNLFWVFLIVLSFSTNVFAVQKSDTRSFLATQHDLLSSLPLEFEQNVGQAPENVKFFTRGDGYTAALTKEAIHFNLKVPDATANSLSENVMMSMVFVNANSDVQQKGIQQAGRKTRYILGNDPNQWKTDIPSYEKIKYENIYKGVDLVFYGNGRELEYDFVVAPGTKTEQIKLTFEGVDRSEIDDEGNLLLEVRGTALYFRAPLSYQDIDGKKQTLKSRYVLNNNTVSFAVDSYDSSRPLVIDPVLVYSSYIGGSGADSVRGVALDSDGNVVVVGQTDSLDFLVTNSAFQTKLVSSDPVFVYKDTFVMKIKGDGTQVISSTFLGGSHLEYGMDVAVDNENNVYITGFTGSKDFPVTANAFQKTYGDTASSGQPWDAYVVKLSPALDQLLYSSYLGSNNVDEATSIGVDETGAVYIAGQTKSNNLPVKNAVQPVYGGASSYGDAFVAKFDTNSSGSDSLVYLTYLGGSASETYIKMYVDKKGYTYVIGYTTSVDFPVFDALQPLFAGTEDLFISKIVPSGNSFEYSTYFGGSGRDRPGAIWADANGSAYVTGSTSLAYNATTNDFPVKGGLPPEFSAPTGIVAVDAFISKLSTSGKSLEFSILYGGERGDYPSSIAADSAGNVIVAGYTSSYNFPLVNELQPRNRSDDGFIVKLNPTATQVFYSTYFGGGVQDYILDIVVTKDDDLIVVGETSATDFPIKNSLQYPNTAVSHQNGFVSRFGDVTGKGYANLVLLNLAGTSKPISGENVNYQYELENIGPEAATGVKVNGVLSYQPAQILDDLVVTASAGTCVIEGNTFTCNFSDLAANEKATLNLQFSAIPGEARITVAAAANQIDNSVLDNSILRDLRVTGTSDLSITANFSQQSSASNAVLADVYQVQISNRGPDNAVGVKAFILFEYAGILQFPLVSGFSCNEIQQNMSSDVDPSWFKTPASKVFECLIGTLQANRAAAFSIEMPMTGLTPEFKVIHPGVDPNLVNNTFSITPVDVTPPVNHPPSVLRADFTLEQGASLEVQLSGTDSDGDSLTYEIHQIPVYGSAVISSAGKLGYTPAPGFSGTELFSYRAFDGQDYSTPAAIAVNVVAPVGIPVEPPVVEPEPPVTVTPPVAPPTTPETNDPELPATGGSLKPALGVRENIFIELDEDSSVVIPDLLAYVIASDASQLSLEIMQAPFHGKLLESNGAYKYVPEKDFFGNDELQFNVTNQAGDTVTVTIPFHVLPLNDPPLFVDQRVNGIVTKVGNSVTVMFHAVDLESSSFKLSYKVSSSLLGAGVLDGNQFVYTASAAGAEVIEVEVIDEEGASAFIYLPITVSDGRAKDSNNDGVSDELANRIGLNAVALEGDSDADGIPDSLELGSVDTPEDKDADGIIDALEAGEHASLANIVSFRVSTRIANDLTLFDIANKRIQLSTETGTRLIVHKENAPLPVFAERSLSHQDNDYEFPLGILDFSVVTEQETAKVTIHYDDTVTFSDDMVVRKMDVEGKWHTLPQAVINPETRSISFVIVDNDIFDLDPTPGVIRDPVGAAVSATTFGGFIDSLNKRAGIHPVLILVFVFLFVMRKFYSTARQIS